MPETHYLVGLGGPILSDLNNGYFVTIAYNVLIHVRLNTHTHIGLPCIKCYISLCVIFFYGCIYIHRYICKDIFALLFLEGIYASLYIYFLYIYNILYI